MDSAKPHILTDFASPNFDDRGHPIDMLILHYTGMKTAADALERLCDPAAKVSAHYVVREDATIFQLVRDKDRAWHAGVSHWAGENDVNSRSIGIEIVNGGHDFGLPDYPEQQLSAVTSLCQRIVQTYNIAPNNVVGHSDVAPERKSDPGEHFPWVKLAKQGLILWPKTDIADQRIAYKLGQNHRDIHAVKSALRTIGYGCELDNKFDDRLGAIIAAFARRYRPKKISSKALDLELLAQITSICGQIYALQEGHIRNKTSTD